MKLRRFLLATLNFVVILHGIHAKDRHTDNSVEGLSSFSSICATISLFFQQFLAAILWILPFLFDFLWWVRAAFFFAKRNFSSISSSFIAHKAMRVKFQEMFVWCVAGSYYFTILFIISFLRLCAYILMLWYSEYISSVCVYALPTAHVGLCCYFGSHVRHTLSEYGFVLLRAYLEEFVPHLIASRNCFSIISFFS